ncbi:MAG: hypothetical protein GF331_08270, partial [Chitinivibrionales bacterium]|nr:hypothetical protein [Chitinivibrionales bacterium]
RNRLAGVREAFEGQGRRVTAVTRDHLAADDWPGGVRGAFQESVDTLRDMADQPGAAPHLTTLTSAIEQASPAVSDAFGREVMYGELQPLWEEALALSGVTAWVAHNDIVGLKALEYLRERGIAVPDDMGLVGFDNTPQASAAGLTSYDHNLEGLSRVLVDYVVGGTVWRRAHAHKDDIEVPGTVIERLTTRGGIFHPWCASSPHGRLQRPTPAGQPHARSLQRQGSRPESLSQSRRMANAARHARRPVLRRAPSPGPADCR